MCVTHESSGGEGNYARELQRQELQTCPSMAKEASKVSVNGGESCARRQWQQSRGASMATTVVRVLLCVHGSYGGRVCLSCLLGLIEPTNA